MARGYDEAVAELHRVAFDDFVSERKRLAEELKAGGDKAAATRLTKHTRPTISAWAVNQLWWRERAEMERLFGAAERMRAGESEQSREHRQALARLRERARELLAESGHASVEATLRRVTATLSALAVNGGFSPDAPGALTNDRDPPGFDLALSDAVASPRVAPPPAPASEEDEARARERREAERDQLRREEEQARRRAERQRVEAELREVEHELGAAELELSAKKARIEQLEAELVALEEGIVRVRARAQELSARLADDPVVP